jgi:hypothetical protein
MQNIEEALLHGLGTVGLEHLSATGIEYFRKTMVAKAHAADDLGDALNMLKLELPPVAPSDATFVLDLAPPLFRPQHAVIQGEHAANYYREVIKTLRKTRKITNVRLYLDMRTSGLRTPAPGIVILLQQLIQESLAQFHYVIAAPETETVTRLRNFRRQKYHFAQTLSYIDDINALPPTWHDVSFMLTDSPMTALTHVRSSTGLPTRYCKYTDRRSVKFLGDRWDTLQQQSSFPRWPSPSTNNKGTRSISSRKAGPSGASKLRPLAA